jgi:hypothetical protein
MLKSSKKPLDSKSFYESRLSISTTAIAATTESSIIVNTLAVSPSLITESPEVDELVPPVLESRSRSRTLEEHELAAIVSNITTDMVSQDSFGSTGSTELMSQSSFVSDDSDFSDDDIDTMKEEERGGKRISGSEGDGDASECSAGIVDQDRCLTHSYGIGAPEEVVTAIERTHMETVENPDNVGDEDDDELEMESIEIFIEDSTTTTTSSNVISCSSIIESDELSALEVVEHIASTSTVTELSGSTVTIVTTPIIHHSAAFRTYQGAAPEISPSDKSADLTADISDSRESSASDSGTISNDRPNCKDNEDINKLKRKIDEDELCDCDSWHVPVNISNGTRGIAPIKLQSVLINADPKPSKRKKVVKTMAVASIKSFFAVKQ